ncbi:hypothetical protein DUI87_01207 [Hirundo rustica rustica]|uniref:ribonuclease H n=1 Tax=Hirundo rustica rustica TaxID=333673 RepID=A0A3M0L4N7_HIRRU|nr:hypothetical protein DUI87_01207 [Hirundo rustica rustica]
MISPGEEAGSLLLPSVVVWVLLKKYNRSGYGKEGEWIARNSPGQSLGVGEEEAKKPYKYDCLYSENEKPVSEIELKAYPGSGQPDTHYIVSWKAVMDLRDKVAKYGLGSSEATWNPHVLDQCQKTGMSALVKAIEFAAPIQRFVTVVQGSKEPFLQFVEKLSASLEKQVEGENLRALLLKQLAKSNSNADCRKLIEALPGDPSLPDMVQACVNVGTTDYKMAALATALLSSWKGPKGRQENQCQQLTVLNLHRDINGVLLQGMQNSPAICQWYVALALSGVRKQFPDAHFYHYMDDILVAAFTQDGLLRIQPQLLNALRSYGLQVSPEKDLLFKAEDGVPGSSVGHRSSSQFGHGVSHDSGMVCIKTAFFSQGGTQASLLHEQEVQSSPVLQDDFRKRGDRSFQRGDGFFNSHLIYLLVVLVLLISPTLGDMGIYMADFYR